ncbi:MAG: hypothetical protein R3297_01545 [Desulfobulbales bacterium]|nr:hypothetical protein [Desulfobulbales bacterium]
MNCKIKALKVKGSTVGIVLLTVCYLLGCSQIRVTSVWVDPEFKGDGIDNVIVVGVSKDGGMRRIFEDEFISLFKQRGVNAYASYRYVSDDKLKDEKNLDRAVKESGSDTILMTRVIDIRKDTQYIPPDYVYAPPRHYHRGWHGYYNRAYMVSPGYTVEYETAVLETNVYDLRTDTLIWSARSDTPTSGNMGKHIRDFARAIIKQLAEARLIN